MHDLADIADWLQTHALHHESAVHDTLPDPVSTGDAAQCQRYAVALRSEGIHVDAIQFPAVPVGQARLRFMLDAGHTRAQIDHAVDVMARMV